MNITYTGRHADISDAEKKKLERRFDKIHRILSAGQPLDAHVVFTKTRSSVEAEVTVRALHHTLVVSDSNANAFTALSRALAKLEKQAVKNKHKLVDTRRPQRQRGEPRPAIAGDAPAAAAAAEPAPQEAETEIVSGNGMAAKPMTPEGARLLLESSDRDQITFRDVDSGNVCVLLRRRDGRVELVDSGA